MDGGRWWFGMDSTSFEIVVEVVKGKVVGKVLERE